MTESAIVTRRNQIRLPDEMMRKYGIEPGDGTAFVECDNVVPMLSLKRVVYSKSVSE
jgi:bifunctional DNA-binding transcriptional regulator/antitoxin component of YhaV-PrlF toxin-antitoxin module